MTQAIVFSHTGGPEVLGLQGQELAAPGPGQVRVRHTAIGVNFIDTYQRSGLYPLPLPSGLGQEAAGVVEALGPEVSGLAVGDRIAYAGGPLGAYSSERLLPAAVLVKLPDGIGDESAACMMLQGMTVEYLVQRTYPVRPGQTVLWHAAAGGVGQIAVQWLTALGATVIGTVGSDAKADIVRGLGCQHVINYSREDVVARVSEITGGQGVPVVYDSVGKDTFQISLACLSPRGMLVSFGNASGAVPPFAPLELTSRGSLFFTRPKLADYIASRAELEASAQALFERVADGRVKVAPSHRYPLAEAAQAHRDLEARKTSGSIILLP
ncbi:quinone oxidoreductase [Chromobacterium alkanivorans]|uniref:quinone oxidoreductase family protein n=1 Tax=Chromobacterium alkanivorans TaxID=1071719 RepID=UPI001967BF08|nr:quinone oxidoreductase [Chromobacterium alkanivorans]MBN3004951.1 quinone oxidoreductase [Chromobacterium alkanivorans]